MILSNEKRNIGRPTSQAVGSQEPNVETSEMADETISYRSALSVHDCITVFERMLVLPEFDGENYKLKEHEFRVIINIRGSYYSSYNEQVQQLMLSRDVISTWSTVYEYKQIDVLNTNLLEGLND
ncbi:uncharacterized protein [Watersipora subatra]|uniref:uncharacterized protein n=1 Tax=Watersipora subatra TaxID=2589382 RepID=UPI00355C6971